MTVNVLRAKSHPYRRVVYQTNIPPTPGLLFLLLSRHHLNHCCPLTLLLTAPRTSSIPPPTDLDHTHPMKRDPRHGLCFNCGKPGHIVKVCQGPCTQNVWNVNATMTPRLTPKDLQFLVDSIKATVAPSMPLMPPPESEGKKTPGDEGF